MSDGFSLSTSRRALLAAGTASLTALAGCSAFTETEQETDLATLDRILLRSDTGNAEPLALTLVYVPRDGSTERPVWSTYEAPASGDPRSVRDFEGDPGTYSLTAHSRNHNNLEVASFNSHGGGVGGGPLQFEVVVKRTGDVWLNVNDAGESISIPGYDG